MGGDGALGCGMKEGIAPERFVGRAIDLTVGVSKVLTGKFFLAGGVATSAEDFGVILREVARGIDDALEGEC